MDEGWIHKAQSGSLHFQSFGVRFHVQVPDAELLPSLPQLLPFATELCPAASPTQGDHDSRAFGSCPEPWFALETPSAGHGFRCIMNGSLCLEHADREPVLARLAHELMLHVAEHVADRVFLHAGVVGWKGRALVLPGPSFAGKTTLVAELVRAGATYFSDEYAVLDATGRVHPYARDLQMRSQGGTAQRGVAPGALGGTSIGDIALPVGLIVFTSFREGAVWQPERVSPGTAVLEAIRHAIPIRRTPARVIATLAAAMEHAPVWRGERGDAAEAARTLLRMMGKDSPQAGDEPETQA